MMDEEYIAELNAIGVRIIELANQLATPPGATIIVPVGGSISAAIALAQPGDTVLITDGTYPPLVTAKVSSDDGVTIRGQSRAGVIIRGIVATGGQYLHWENFTVSGPIVGAANTKAGVYLAGVGTHDQTFTGCDVRVTSGSGADSTPQMAIRSGAHHITIDGCNLDATNALGGQARCIYVYGSNVVDEVNYCHDIAITNNTIGGADADAIFAQGMYAMSIVGNTFNSLKDNSDHNDYIQLLRPWHDIEISGNTFNDECDQCIQVNGSNNMLPLVANELVIKDNMGVNLAKNGMSLAGVNGGTVSGNDFSDCGNDSTGEGIYGLVLWCGQLELGAQGAPVGSRMNQNTNLTITGNTFGSKLRRVTDITADGVNGNVITANDIII